MDIDTLKTRTLRSNCAYSLGTQGLGIDGDELWIIPMKGSVIVCWNPKPEKQERIVACRIHLRH